MRQGQPQNRQRSRGRGNNNNRNSNVRNQLNRSMESNGPDVRIRGTAAHIAEKYTQLANDTLTAGDTVGAQSYWQFAEHYNRLVATAQAAQQQARDEQQVAREARGETDSDGDDNRSEERGRDRPDRPDRQRGRRGNRDDDATQETKAETAPADESVNGAGPQPVLNDTPAEVALNENAVETSVEEAAPAKPKKTKRARKPKDEAAALPADDASGLPAFVTGSE
jgi:hypothetical protein